MEREVKTITVTEKLLSKIVKEFNLSYPRYKGLLHVSYDNEKFVFIFHNIKIEAKLSELQHDYGLENLTSNQLFWLNISDVLHQLIVFHEESLNE